MKSSWSVYGYVGGAILLTVFLLVGWMRYSGDHFLRPLERVVAPATERYEARYHPLQVYNLNGKEILLEVVTSTADMAQGLGDRDQLPANHGMLFTYDAPAVRPFWMRHMQFPIDIIWIEKGKVVDIASRLPAPKTREEIPVTYTPQERASWVLEIPAGAAEMYGLVVGGDVDLVPKP